MRHHIAARLVTACQWLIRVASVAVLASCGKPDAPVVNRIDITGGGATFPYPLYRAWFSEYAAKTGTRINYFSVGSAEGMRLVEQGEVDFGATDRPPQLAPREPQQCDKIQVPMVSGFIAIAYNLPQLSAPLRLNAETLADIFSARVKHWNAAAIQAVNPNVVLPSDAITVVHRGVGSGTSHAFGEFLATSTHWPKKSSADMSETFWPVGIAAEGNEGVAIEVKVRSGTIGYVEATYAKQNNLSVALIESENGRFLPPSIDTAGYPIVARTWLVVDPVHVRAGRGEALVNFVRWALHDGGQQARLLGYRAAPPDTVAHYDSMLRALQFVGCARGTT